ncbi:MAG: hypothetical protein ACO1OQ_06305 [Rufibacter sp.]
MKIRFLYFLCLFLVFSCQKKQAEISSPKPQDTVFITQPEKVKSDTLYQTEYIEKDHYYDTTLLKVGRDTYLCLSEAYSLNDSSLTETEEWGVEGFKFRQVRYHNNLYKVKLLKNGNTVFDRNFTKKDLIKLESDNPYVKGGVARPFIFKGITGENKLVFDVWLGYQDSDVGGISTLVTDYKGKPLLLQNYNHTGGGGCDGELQLTSDRKYYLNCSSLYGPNGYKFDFEKNNVVHASFLTDTSFVVIYDYILKTELRKGEFGTYIHEERDEKSKNVIIYHVNGKKLEACRYDGFFQELGYSAPVAKVDSSFVLLDGEKKFMQIINIKNPSLSRKISLNELEKVENRMRDSLQKEVKIITDLTRYYFYFSPNKIRYYTTSTSE